MIPEKDIELLFGYFDDVTEEGVLRACRLALTDTSPEIKEDYRFLESAGKIMRMFLPPERDEDAWSATEGTDNG